MEESAHGIAEQAKELEASPESLEEVVDNSPPAQTWTQSGYPIVAGKYLEKGTVKDADPKEPTQSGPPNLDIYWHNRYLGPEPDLFRGVACAGHVDVTEYLARLGTFLRMATEKGSCRVMALNATLYSVNIIVAAQETRADMVQLLLEYGLAPVPPP